MLVNVPSEAFKRKLNNKHKLMIRLAIEDASHDILCAPKEPLWYMEWNPRYNNTRFKAHIAEQLTKVCTKYWIPQDEVGLCTDFINTFFARLEFADKRFEIEPYQNAAQRISSLTRVNVIRYRLEAAVAEERRVHV